MSAKHTLGPWHIGMKPGPMVYGGLGEQVADCRGCGLGESRHNARLIAAAPEMLAALEGCIHHNDAVKPQYKIPESLERQIRAAIAKAKGE